MSNNATSKITISSSAQAQLSKLAADHNASLTDDATQVNPSTLSEVFRRGIADLPKAGQSNTAMAERYALTRVKAFLQMIADGKPLDPSYTEDLDLAPAVRASTKALPQQTIGEQHGRVRPRGPLGPDDRRRNDVRDADNDGLIQEGTEFERRAPAKQPEAATPRRTRAARQPRRIKPDRPNRTLLASGQQGEQRPLREQRIIRARPQQDAVDSNTLRVVKPQQRGDASVNRIANTPRARLRDAIAGRPSASINSTTDATSSRPPTTSDLPLRPAQDDNRTPKEKYTPEQLEQIYENMRQMNGMTREEFEKFINKRPSDSTTRAPKNKPWSPKLSSTSSRNFRDLARSMKNIENRVREWGFVPDKKTGLYTVESMKNVLAKTFPNMRNPLDVDQRSPRESVNPRDYGRILGIIYVAKLNPEGVAGLDRLGYGGEHLPPEGTAQGVTSTIPNTGKQEIHFRDHRTEPGHEDPWIIMAKRWSEHAVELADKGINPWTDGDAEMRRLFEQEPTAYYAAGYLYDAERMIRLGKTRAAQRLREQAERVINTHVAMHEMAHVIHLQRAETQWDRQDFSSENVRNYYRDGLNDAEENEVATYAGANSQYAKTAFMEAYAEDFSYRAQGLRTAKDEKGVRSPAFDKLASWINERTKSAQTDMARIGIADLGNGRIAVCTHGENQPGYAPEIILPKRDDAQRKDLIHSPALNESIHYKILRTRGRAIPSPRFEPYDAFPLDGDGDGIVQEGTIWERPAGTRFVDKLGKEVAHDLAILHPSANHHIVDADNKRIDYKPTWHNKTPERLGPSIRTMISDSERLAGRRTGRDRKLAPLKVEALRQWFNGDTMTMREHTIAILNNDPIESMPGAKWRSLREAKADRAATAALMDFVSDGSPYDKSLYRGELLPMSAKSLIDELAPGTEFVLPMRSFSRKEATAMDYFDSDYATSFEEGTQVIYELLPGSQGANFQEIAAQLEQEGLSYDQTWSSEDRFMLSSDVEHVIFGTVEVVKVEQVSHPTFGPIFHVTLRQTDTLGKPADRDTWS